MHALNDAIARADRASLGERVESSRSARIRFMAQPIGVISTPRTFGILSIVFASIVFASSLLGVGGLVVPTPLVHAPPSGRPEGAQVLQMMSGAYVTMGICS